ncbi:MAG: hypothetical protein ABJC39_08375 [Chloroflexota bacterium]
MTDRPEPRRFAGPDPGLCGACRHSQVVETRRGSAFRLCRRSLIDAAFPRYPPLPVLGCAGFEPALSAMRALDER